MKEEDIGNPSQRERIDRLTRLLAKDLAELARAQAKLMIDLVDLLDMLPESDGQFPLQDKAESADMRYREEPDPEPVPPQPESTQLDMFADDPEKQLQEKMLHKAMDSINQRYGEFTLSPARLLQRSDMPNVIAPAWKPDGHRQTI